MAMWFLKQTEQLSRPSSQTIGVNQTDNRELMTKNCESPFYPPIDEELLLRMIKYLHNFKKYDIDLLGNFKISEKSKIPSNITPEESVCIDCQTPLSNPLRFAILCVYLQCKEWLLVLNHILKNVVFVNYINDTKVGTMMYIIITTV